MGLRLTLGNFDADPEPSDGLDGRPGRRAREQDVDNLSLMEDSAFVIFFALFSFQLITSLEPRCFSN